MNANSKPLSKKKKIKSEQPDFVVVAGDWTYEPENRLVQELAVLKYKCLFIRGNHDEQYPGPPIQELLAKALSGNVMDIEGKIIEFDEFRLVGIGICGQEKPICVFTRVATG